ncbi:MFS transporter [Streptomyces pinistramenti]|uniref:MFS transporter n=1 Tax=Streptomyces pinistramenti TaxID=2884812 RepID=UPI001D080A1C|nr:MFS transporter [Streptomyces pinistramenti]MCB5910013.1 MFS transporter [Streptomyces pinistramenti]
MKIGIPRGPVRVLTIASFITTLGSGLYLAGSMLFFTRVVGLSVASVSAGLAVSTFVGLLSGLPLGAVADRVGPRGLYVATQGIQAVAMFLFPTTHTFAGFLTLVTVAAVGQRGAQAVSGALIARISEPGQRTRVRGYLRAVTNLGLGIGAAAAGVALQLDSTAGYTLLILANGLSFLAAAGMLLMIPSVEPVPRPPDARRMEAVRDRPYLALSLLCGVIAFQYDVISLILPLWLVSHTTAPRWWLSALLVVNTAVVVLFQVRATRGVRGPLPASSALRGAGFLSLAGCTVLAFAAGVSAPVAAALLLVGVLLLSWGELGLAAGAFEISFGLAPEHAQGQYQGTFNLADGVVRAASPIVLTTLCLQWGRTGWLVLGVILALCGLATRPLTRWALLTRTFPVPETPAPVG